MIRKKKYSLEQENKKLTERISILEQARIRLEKEKAFLECYKDAVITISRRDHDIGELMNASNMETMAQFMLFYSNQILRLEKEIMDLRQSLGDLEKEKDRLQKEIKNEKPEWSDEEVRQSSVLLTCQQLGEIELNISYVISNASWYPVYDVRVNSKDKTMEVAYYGIITQNTEEDWINTNVTLSTADPTDRTAPINLQRMLLTFVTPYLRSHTLSSRTRKERKSSNKLEQEADEYDAIEAKKEKMPSLPPMVKKMVKMAETTAEEGTIYTKFHIPRTITIPSDDAPHKVAITVQKLTANLSYYSVPKLDSNVYLKVETVNSSTFPFLSGQMNVFVDNIFVSTGTMESCNPNEEFSSFLGTDPSIKINYAAPKRFKETVGLLKGSMRMTIERRITIKNTKQTDATLIITDQVPKSEDEKIKVKITKPPFNETSELTNIALTDTIVAESVKLTEKNNVEWKINVPSNKEFDPELVYNVTWSTSSPLNTSDM
jgi:uncharacterized protein (TIGR02231 family)